MGILALLTIHGIAADRLGEHWLWLVTLVVTAAFMGAVTAALLYYVLDWHPITTDKVFGAVAAYVLIAFTFACLFGLLQQIQPHAFHAAAVHAPDAQFDWSTMMYFSFTVLTSTGFGEITPVTRMARALIVIEQVLGVMYVAFLVARLANLYGARRDPRRDALRLGRAERFFFEQLGAERAQTRHLRLSVDAEATPEAFGDESGNIRLGEAAEQQIRRVPASTIASTAA